MFKGEGANAIPVWEFNYPLILAHFEKPACDVTPSYLPRSSLGLWLQPIQNTTARPGFWVEGVVHSLRAPSW